MATTPKAASVTLTLRLSITEYEALAAAAAAADRSMNYIAREAIRNHTARGTK